MKEQKWKNHHDKNMAKLLAIPRYADLLQDLNDKDEDNRGRALVTTQYGWKVEMAKWCIDVREAEQHELDAKFDNGDNNFSVEALTVDSTCLKVTKWKPTTLATLFGEALKH
jgi:hypothetical protein